MEIERIAEQIELAFEGRTPENDHAWHGPSVCETLQGIHARQALNKLPHSHSIIELVMHMATWRTFVVKRLEGDNAFDVTDDTDFLAGTDWEAALRRLQESQENLLAVLRNFPEEKLHEVVPSRTYTFYTMLHGIVHHDIYHTGQIALLKKS